MFAYCVAVNDKTNELEVLIYSVDMKHKDKNAYYEFTYVETIRGDLQEIIPSLREEGMISITKFGMDNFNCPKSDYNYNLRSFFLPFENQLIEKVFDLVPYNNTYNVILYITYVNIKTGVVRALKVGNIGIANKVNSDLLEQYGFKYMIGSYLGEYLREISSENKKPFVLERKK